MPLLPVLFAMGAGLTLTPPPASSSGPSNCPVTLSNGSQPPGEVWRYPYGNGTLWTEVWRDGRMKLERRAADGRLTTAFPWWKGEAGELTITGRRLDEDAKPMGVVIPKGYRAVGFQSSQLFFPSEGCWEITAKLGDDTLTIVTEVVQVEPRPR
jgi:hypothetical protein